MSTVVTIIGSGPAGPGVDALLSVVRNRISHSGHVVVPLAAGPDVAEAVAAVDAADGVVVLASAGRRQPALDLLPADALRGKALLLLTTGSAGAQTAIQDALRPALARLAVDDVRHGHFVPDGHVRAYPNGGVVLDAASAVPVAETTDAFLRELAHQPPAAPPRDTRRVSPVAGSPDLTVVGADVHDPVLAPLLRDLMIEYSTRYGGPSPYTTLTEVPPSDFAAPDGAFLALTQNGETIAGGALRRYDGRTAEVKRVWTSARHRRRGLALRLMAELEAAALSLGYDRIHVTTGRRQPEAVGLYLAAGYLPRFDVTADLGDAGPLAFGKELVAGAGLVDWVEPSADEYYRTGEASDPQSSAVPADGVPDVIVATPSRSMNALDGTTSRSSSG